MKKFITFAFALCIFALNNMLFAQITESGDTLIIGPTNHDATNIGALNYYIKADTALNGDRLHSVYKILKNKTYILTATINANFPLILVADKATGSDKPPIIRTGLNAEGGTIAPLISTTDDWTMKNVYISGIVPTGDAGIWAVLSNNGSHKKINFMGCTFEHVFAGWGLMWGYGASHTSYNFEDCTVRNSLSSGGTWGGSFLVHGVVDTVKFVNSTFFNMQGPLFTCDEGIGQFYTEINHCTFVNGVVHQFILNKPVIAKITNNIFYNCYSHSGGPFEVNKHADKELHGIIHMFAFDAGLLDTNWTSLYDPNGDGTLTEDERTYELKNNAWFYSSEITDYWSTYDSLATQTLFNNAVKEYFVNNTAEKQVTIVGGAQDGSDTTWTYAPHPFYVEENNKNEDPSFANTGGSEARLATNLAQIRGVADTSKHGSLWHFETDDNLTLFEWPLPEDLSYSNTSLQSAGTDGFALGDLNWFPSQKTQWLTDVEPTGNGALVDEFRISQNYPNPFNPTTNIEFAIPENSLVSLKVFNVLGEEVAELLNKELSSGTYNVNFDASQLTTGIYFYTLTSGNFVQTKKMLLLK